MTIETKPVVQKRPINRLQTMYALRALLDQQYKDTTTAKKEGKLIAWCMMEGFAAPFLNAMDINSVYTENYATSCAAAKVALGYVDRSESEGFPTTLCGYAQNCFGYTARFQDLGWQIPPEAPIGGMPKPDLIIGQCGGTCDARYKWYQALGRYLDCPVWIMETSMPSGKESLMPEAHERHVQFAIEHLREFVAFLERLTGRKFPYEKLSEDVDDTKEMNAIWYEITNELRKARPCPMNARDHYSAMNQSLFRANDPKAVTELYKKMYDEVKYRVDNKIAGINYPEKYRTHFTGLGPWHCLQLFDRLAEKGWNFVHEDYHPGRPIDLSWVKDPIEKLVRNRMRGLEWQLDETWPPEEAAEIKKEIMTKGFSKKASAGAVARDYQLDGVILHTALTCRMTSCRTGLTQRLLMDVWKVPSLQIQGDMVDARLFDLEDFLRKAEAFEETMDYYKEVRRKEGLPW